MITSLSCDLLIRIKNGSRAGRKSITAPLSKFSVAILEKLKKHGFISDFSVDDQARQITIKDPHVFDIRILSRPGRRLYCAASSIPWGKTPRSLIIISSSSGLLSQKEAAAKKLGGELIAEIW
jgi:small subunit ribosomal protein S8